MVDKADMPCFLDIEASSLSKESYPVQIAWSLEDESIEHHYLNPYCIDDWTDWDPVSQDVHGLSRAQLSNIGEDP